jgi:hypothetical protein
MVAFTLSDPATLPNLHVLLKIETEYAKIAVSPKWSKFVAAPETMGCVLKQKPPALRAQFDNSGQVGGNPAIVDDDHASDVAFRKIFEVLGVDREGDTINVDKLGLSSCQKDRLRHRNKSKRRNDDLLAFLKSEGKQADKQS